MVENLINHGADVNYDVNDREDNMYPLKKAIEISNYNIVKYLINNGADVNYDHDDQYPLEYAIWNCNDEEIVKFLIDQGADVGRYKYNKEDSPLEYAIRKKKDNIAKYLIQHGAYINKNEFYFSPLICAFTFNNENMINYLLKQNVDINEKTI